MKTQGNIVAIACIVITVASLMFASKWFNPQGEMRGDAGMFWPKPEVLQPMSLGDGDIAPDRGVVPSGPHLSGE